MTEILGSLLLLLGVLTVLVGGVGLFRFPDFFCRLHSASIVDTLGAGLVLLGMLVLSGSVVIAFKVAMIGALIFFLSPMTAHALARAALRSGMHRDKPGSGPSTGGMK